MPRYFLLYAAIPGVLGFVAGTGALAETHKTDAHAFLEKAAGEQQIEISLGQLATQRATNEKVKEFGAQMVEDHKKASQQVEQLALKQGWKLAPGLSQVHTHKVNELAQLSGHAFDREYMNYILEDHEITLDEFQQRVKTLQDQDIKQWITSILPTLQSHREKARQVKYSLQTNP